MIKSILVANRGEIACRIFKTCKQMGIKPIAVFSDADANAPYVKMADTAYHIGTSEVKTSYLNIEKIIEAAKATGADAIHPGYGFLSEHAAFANRLQQEGIVFIGPNVHAIEWMGSKSKAKEIAEKNMVPIVPGYRGNNQTLEKFSSEAEAIGFPILLKATAGGGGKGMRIVNQHTELEHAFKTAKLEALNAFGNDELLIEKYFPSARHIEIQIMGDKHGNIIHLLERECTIQRRYQKVLEESPSPILTAYQRSAMCQAALRLAKALNYDNAGTVEFIFSNNEFYFLEVNTRLQVEHPVTEAITGLDLVQLQIEVAEGKPLTIQQSDVVASGYALQCRLYAEDTENNFLPSTGTVALWNTPSINGLRFDSGIETGSSISMFYDPMLSKIIAHGTSRNETIRKMEYALRNTTCLGTTTNHNFLLAVLTHPDFIEGNYDTHFIANQTQLCNSSLSPKHLTKALVAATLFRWYCNEQQRQHLQHIPSLWRNNFFAPAPMQFKIGNSSNEVHYTYQNSHFEITVNESLIQASHLQFTNNKLSVILNGMLENFTIAQVEEKIFIRHYEFPQVTVEFLPRFPKTQKKQEKGSYATPIPATVTQVLVSVGSIVSNGQALVILSSMKMENTIIANENGTVEEIFVANGDNIEAGKLLLKITPNSN